MRVRSRAPLRISFAGGGTDVSPYCDENTGAVLNSTINRYVYITLEPMKGENYTVESLDYGIVLESNINEEIIFDGQLNVVKGVIKKFKKDYSLKEGFRLSIFSDAPPGSGLGSSSTLVVALIDAFREWMNLPLTLYEIANLAVEIERKDVGIIGGKQDQFAAAFGGFNFIEFFKDKTTVNSLRLREEIKNELECSILLCYVGGSRLSNHIIESQTKRYMSGENFAYLNNIKTLANEMKKCLIKGDLVRFGRLLDEEWKNKKLLTEGITNQRIDKIYKEVIAKGALGGKISGAGGGGYMFFFAEQDYREEILKSLKNLNVEVVPFSFVEKGVISWKLQ